VAFKSSLSLHTRKYEIIPIVTDFALVYGRKEIVIIDSRNRTACKISINFQHMLYSY